MKKYQCIITEENNHLYAHIQDLNIWADGENLEQLYKDIAEATFVVMRDSDECKNENDMPLPVYGEVTDGYAIYVDVWNLYKEVLKYTVEYISIREKCRRYITVEYPDFPQFNIYNVKETKRKDNIDIQYDSYLKVQEYIHKLVNNNLSLPKPTTTSKEDIALAFDVPGENIITCYFDIRKEGESYDIGKYIT